MNIRAGDIVSLKLLVTDVADYGTRDNPNLQQVMGKLLPNGDRLGWLVPQEAEFTLAVPAFKVGDEIYIPGPALNRQCKAKGRVIARVTDETDRTLLWVQLEDGNMETIVASTGIERID